MFRRLLIRSITFAIATGILAATIGLLEFASWGILRAKGKTGEEFGRRYNVPPHVAFVPWVGLRYLPLREGVRTGLGTDRHGFLHNGNRDRDLSTKAPGVYRIFVLGGSPIAGEGNPKQTISGRLETLLNADPNRPSGRRYEVVSAAMEGYLTSQDLAMLEYYLPEFQPDLIVSISGFNDVFHVLRAPFEKYLPNVSGHLTNQAQAAYIHTYSLRGNVAQVFGMLHARSYTANFWDEMIASIRAHLPGAKAAAAVAQAAPMKLPTMSAQDLAPYQRNVELMIAASHTLGAAHAAILMPTVLVSNSAGRTYRDARIADSRSRFLPFDYWGAKDQLYSAAEAIFANLVTRYDDGRATIVRDYSHLFDQESSPSFFDESHYTTEATATLTARLAEDLERTILAASTSAAMKAPARRP